MDTSIIGLIVVVLFVAAIAWIGLTNPAGTATTPTRSARTSTLERRLRKRLAIRSLPTGGDSRASTTTERRRHDVSMRP